MTTVSAAGMEVTKSSPPPLGTNGKLRVMCRYGGGIVSLPQTKSLHYVGGDTRIVAVPMEAAINFASLVNHLSISLGVSSAFKIKYQLPNYGLDSLISIETDEDLEIMMEEHGRLSFDSSPSPSRIRLFLFPSQPVVNESSPIQAHPTPPKVAAGDIDWFGFAEPKPTRCRLAQAMLQHPKRETWFVDALRGAEMMQNEGNNGRGGSGDGNTGLSGQESLVLETSSSFGSTSSSVSSTNLPPIKSSGEENMSSVQVKFAPTESVTSDKGVVTPTSHVQIRSTHPLPTLPHVPEDKVDSKMSETETSLLNTKVQIPEYPPSPMLDQAQRQHIQVIYPGQHYIMQSPPAILPSPSYYPAYIPLPHHPNHVHFQPPQAYPAYYIPAEQYSQPNSLLTQTGLMETPVVSTSLPPESPVLASPVHPASQLEDTAAQKSNEEDIKHSNDAEEEAARAQIYKSQPPAPLLFPSQYQTVMLTEALAQLRS